MPRRGYKKWIKPGLERLFQIRRRHRVFKNAKRDKIGIKHMLEDSAWWDRKTKTHQFDDEDDDLIWGSKRERDEGSARHAT